MSHPFLLWCRQRTGSISLFYSMTSVSEHEAAQPEPFDRDIDKDRQFSAIRRMSQWERDRALREICDKGYLIKHCYENLPEDFNHALAEISTRAGYRHVHLRRRDETARLISKGIAEQYATWVPGDWTTARFEELTRRGQIQPLDVAALKTYHDVSEARWAALAGLLRAYEVSFEDLFSRPKPTLSRLAAYIGVPQSSVGTMLSNLGNGQNTAGIWKLIPNVEELRKVINSGGGN
jgi:hypothetical protein